MDRTMNARRWLITLAACVVIFAVLAGYKFLQIKAAIAFGESFPEPSESVEAMVVDSQLARTYVTTIGEIVAPQSIELRTEVEGRITAVNVKSGEVVKQGDILLQLDISEEAARLKAAQARARLAGLELERFTRLLASKTVSEDQVDKARAEFDIARATVAELEAIIAKKTLQAPFDAVAGLHQLEAGEFLQSNTPVVMLVGISDVVWVDFDLSISQGSLELGDEVEVILAGNRWGTPLLATIIAIEPVVSATSRNRHYRAKITVDSPLPPNTVVNIRVPAGQENQVQLPATAIIRDELGAYVFVLDAEAGDSYRARRQSVTLGGQEGDTAFVRSGLQPGDLVATHGAFKLRHGLHTYIRERTDPTKRKASQTSQQPGE